MPFFKNVFKSKDGSRAASKAGKHADQDRGLAVAQPKLRWEEAWSRKEVAPEEIQELIHVCTHEIKSRALDLPFLLLPFRPASDPSAARNFIRNFFKSAYDGTRQFEGDGLQQELRLAEPLVLCSIMKWCWSRLSGGVVTWDAYELFRIGESDSNFARHAFDTFIPLSVESTARKQMIFDFFDLLAAIAARGKTNGMGGRKLSRMAGWWAFEFADDGKGFDGGYRSWEKAADAASHLFFAYLRSLAPDTNAISGISALPRSLQALLSQTEYPPSTPVLLQTTTTKVVMIVDSVSPTPFALLRRAKHFEYRDDDEALQRFSAYDDTVKALTDECRRVLEYISATNQSVVTTDKVGSPDPSWSRFEDMGFSGLLDSPTTTSMNGTSTATSPREFSSLRTGPRSRTTDFGRPTTPSWADFLSSGFADENGRNPSAPFLMPDKILPPIGEAARVHSSQSHVRNGLQTEEDLEPGELASITRFDLDDTFWWVWQTSLAAEETSERKAAFGRCTLIETRIPGAKWLVMEEQVKGASPGPEEGAYIVEKKGRFSFTRRGRLGRRKSTGKKPTPPKEPYNRTTSNTPMSKTSIGPDQHARIQAAAAKLAQNQRDQAMAEQTAQRRARKEDNASVKTNSVLTLQPNLLSDAGPAMKWDKRFGEGASQSSKDRDNVRAQYLGDVNAGKGSKDNLLSTANGGTPATRRHLSDRDLPSLPELEQEAGTPRAQATASPLPFPTTPKPEDSKVPEVEASSAARVPLPNNAAMSPTVLDEKPAAENDYYDTHPALRQQVLDRKPVAPAKQEFPVSKEEAPIIESGPTRTEAPTKKSPPKKLKKKDGSGGFRKLFGKKKAEVPVATAVETPEVENSYPEQDVHQEEPVHSSEVPPREPSPPLADERSHSPALEPSPAVNAVQHGYREVLPSDAMETEPTPREQHDASHAFARFDQGPMDDMPAFAPEDSDDDESMASPVVPRYPTNRGAQGSEPSTPTPLARPPMDNVSEESVDLGGSSVNPQDRWALIRKNAAERAARLSEEQSRRSQSQSARTDEGETSGEETIESRVARIKARVAELTGNMDGSPAQAAAAGRRH